MRSALLIAAGGLILFLVMLLAAGARGTFAAVDSEAALLGREVAASGADGVTRIVTDFGSLPAAATAAVIAGFALVFTGRPAAAAALILGLAAIVLAGDLIKDAVARERPTGAGPGLTTASFPSGHAAYSTVYVAAAAALTAGLAKGRRTLIGLVVGALALALAVGLTRVVLGAHYLSDVLAGWALGAAVFGLSAGILVTIGLMRDTEGESRGAAPAGGNQRT